MVGDDGMLVVFRVFEKAEEVEEGGRWVVQGCDEVVLAILSDVEVEVTVVTGAEEDEE